MIYGIMPLDANGNSLTNGNPLVVGVTINRVINNFLDEAIKRMKISKSKIKELAFIATLAIYHKPSNEFVGQIKIETSEQYPDGLFNVYLKKDNKEIRYNEFKQIVTL